MNADISFVQSEQALHEEAMQQSGTGDFGDCSYLEGMRVVLAAYDGEAKFHPAGRQAARATLVQALKTRLRSQQLLQQHAAVLTREIRRPVIVLGLVRTGSTALHHLLGQDPDINVLEYWLAAHPQPRPPRSQWRDLPDFQESAAEIEGMYAFDPSLRGVHLMAPDLAEECRHLLAQSFTDDAYEVNATVPSYTKWYENGHHRAAYLRHRDLIKLIGSTAPADRRWILKYPVHMKHLGALLEVYPDACIVQTHRDPSRVLASYIDLIAGFRAIFEQDIDRAAIGREQLEVWAAGSERAIAVRREHHPSQFFDLYFHEFVADPIGSVRRIYERFGLSLSAAAEERMRQWQQSTPEGKHGKRHTMEDVGITRAEVLDRFAAYMKYFDLKPE
ncbi:MAG: sulfotransferase [Deltaproteobacteria bacterium]|nr:sulfotransferase [Deltaproteobacteria bacterium]